MVERLWADALGTAERRHEDRIASRPETTTRTALDGLLSDTLANGTTRLPLAAARRTRGRLRGRLADVLARLAELRHNRVHELSPGNSKGSRKQNLSDGQR